MENTKEKSACIEGLYILTAADVSTPEAKALETRATQARDAGDHVTAGALIRELNTRFGKEVGRFHNLIPTVGRSVLAQRLANVTTYTGVVNYMALGTSGTTPANGDTALGTETYRKVIASATYANNIAYISGFFTAAEVSGTFAECGLFIDGAAGANTGQIFTHALISVTKSGAQTLTIDVQITFS